LRGRRAGGLADADADARQRKRCHALRHAAKKGHRAPECECDRHDVAAAEPVGEARDGNAEQRIKQYEAKAREQTHRSVAQDEFSFDWLDQDVEDRAVEKVQGVDDRQDTEHVIASDGGCRRSLRLVGRGWCEISHVCLHLVRVEWRLNQASRM
jgi:hypothetical protein